MKTTLTIMATIGAVLLLALTGCLGGGTESGEHGGDSESREHTEGSETGEHSGESDGGEAGEESRIQYALEEELDEVRAGMRLILSYDSASNTFSGTVQNTTDAALPRVRVEVHLSTGVELGPTTPVELAPGELADIKLPATDQPFEAWSAHPEAG